MIRRAEGLVLRTHRMTETSLVLVAFTREWGKVRLAAKGARRPRSRFGASLQPVTRSHLVYYHKDGRDLQTLSEGDILDTYPAIKRDYERLAFASAVCELLDIMTVEEDANAMLFEIACDTLSWMDRAAPEHLEIPLWFFQLKASGELGYRPQLTGCVRTGRPLKGAKVWFSADLGGVTQEETEGGGLWLDAATLSFLVHLQAGRPDRVEVSGFAKTDAGSVRRALRLFLDHHVEGGRQLKAAAFLTRILASRERRPAGHSPAYAVAAEPSSAYRTAPPEGER